MSSNNINKPSISFINNEKPFIFESDLQVKHMTSDRYEKIKKEYVNGAAKYEIHRSGDFETLINRAYKVAYSVRREPEFIWYANEVKGRHLIGLLRKAILEKVENGIIEPPKPLPEPMFKYVNPVCVENGLGKGFITYDIDDAYWVAAYKLGYLNEAEFDRGNKKAEYKSGKVVAVGALNRKFHIECFDNKVMTHRKVIEMPEVLRNARLQIINYVNDTMLSACKNAGVADVAMLLTDEIFIDENSDGRAEIVKTILKAGFSFKSDRIRLLAFHLNTVHFCDYYRLDLVEKAAFSPKQVFPFS